MTGQHFLVVAPFDPDDDTDRFDVEHPDDCPRVDLLLGVECPAEAPAWRYDCAVAHHLDDGIDCWFRHADDPDPLLPDSAEPVPTGRHEIETWSHRHPAGPWGLEEWDGGVRLVEVTS